MAPVRLYLVRHGVAEERGPSWPDDSMRPLTAEGIERMREVARGLAAAGVEFDEILTSPLTRARQTAELLARAYGRPPRVATFEALAGGSPPAVVNGLARFARRRSLALVGHEPALGELAAVLVGASQAIPFKKGGVCCVAVDGLPPAVPATLEWFMPPRLLRRLARGE